jgi:hypothetical protein
MRLARITVGALVGQAPCRRREHSGMENSTQRGSGPPLARSAKASSGVEATTVTAAEMVLFTACIAFGIGLICMTIVVLVLMGAKVCT